MKDTNELLIQLNSKFDKLLELISGGVSFVDKSPTACDITFGDWLDEWYSTYKMSKGLRSSYLKDLRYSIDRYILPNLGLQRLKDINGMTLQIFLNGITVKNLQKKIAMILNASLNKAVALGKLDKNPYVSVELCRAKSEHYKALDYEQQNAVMNSITVSKYLAYFWVMCCTGMRVGEFLALDFERDIDYVNGIIRVSKSVDVHSGELYHTPKTVSSIRDIPFLGCLKPYLKILEKDKVTYNGLHCYFARIYKKLGYSGYNLYTFRHTFASLCYSVKIPEKITQSLLGHTDINLTMNTYTHVLDKGYSKFGEYILMLKEVKNW